MGKARKPSRRAQPRHQLPPARTVTAGLASPGAVRKEDPGQTHRGQSPPPNAFSAGFANKVPVEKTVLQPGWLLISRECKQYRRPRRAQPRGGGWQPQAVVLAGDAEDAEVGGRASEDPQV